MNNSFPVKDVAEEVYIGTATSHSLKEHAQSGGVVTALALTALKSGLVDSIVTTVSDSKEPQKAIPYVLKNPIDAPKIGGSRYCYCPILYDLKNVCLASRSVCVIGLPCHLSAVQLARNRFKLINSKLKLLIGLLCFNNFTYTSLKEGILLKGFRVDPTRVRRINIERGFLEIKLDDGSVKKKRVKEFYGLLRRACLTCRHFIPPVCDLAVGASGAPRGYSVILVYTKLGRELLYKSVDDNLIEIARASNETREVLRKLVLIKSKRALGK